MTDFTDTYIRASKLFRAVMTAGLRRHGLHLGQNLVLVALVERDGRTPGEIAAETEVTTPTIVKMANRMAASGLLIKKRDTHDNRLVRLHLTPAGRRLAGPVATELQAVDARLTAGLSDAQRRTLLRLLDKVNANAAELLATWNEPADEQ
ncbi:MarR family winged helix-turn-helix transcriptional regulator [Microlunatus sp. Gsoil 973]|jgi:DNA-binding MarR family transcriptional regulator|uniref:MarR family winged helix-turn-helix transcriptional regulator n=1 Tax=Microlunatus sp. Gsoil 973 TaxID=2672569 RepID=UPI0012B45CAC|nr:MarR family winged helix-turn-helix transcriptional regulator [Microlunatus sp. Gsoil 973]QGN32220.1 MarR family transcriptional regulator [Microlunatus sp. Gsoil 973]